MAPYRYWIGIGASTIIGIIFVMAGVGKLPHQGEYWGLMLFEFSDSLVLMRFVDLVKNWLPWMEIVLGSLLIIGIAAKFVASSSSTLIFGFTANNIWMIYHGAGREPCGCFGRFEEFLGTLSAKVALYMDIGMLALVLIVLLCYPGNLFSIKPGWLKLQKPVS